METLETIANKNPLRIVKVTDACNTVCPTCNKKIVGAYEVEGSTKYHLGWCYKQRNQD